MDPLLLRYYNRELQYIREMGGEFARDFPKIAGRLGLEEFECADPYVERLLEGFAFLAARVQLKIDAEFPQFTQHLLEIAYPHYLAPTPSMAVVQFQPNPQEGSLVEGFRIPRGTVLRSLLGKGDQTACEYRTADEVTLWPLELVAADYTSRDVAAVSLPRQVQQGVRAVLRLRLRTTAGLKFKALPLDSLRIFIRGGEERSLQLYEQLHGNALGVLVRPAGRDGAGRDGAGRDGAGRDAAGQERLLDKSNIGRVGLEDHQALLPYPPRSFQGYRLLHEYFAFHQRFLFFELSGLAESVRRCDGEELELLVLLDRVQPSLENLIDSSNFSLFCGAAINLFPHRADRVHLDLRETEFHVVPDRTRPMDLEVYQITGVTGYGDDVSQRQAFRPIYSVTDGGEESEGDAQAFYTVRRMPRLLSTKLRAAGPRTSYIGSEVFLSLVDGRDAPYRRDLTQLEVTTLCTNRDLPLHMPVGRGVTDFTLESGAPVKTIRCMAGPTEPRPPLASGTGETVWRLISQLSLNYLSLVDNDDRQGAAALRELLKIHANIGELANRKQIDGVKSIGCQPIIRRLPRSGPVTYGRGLEITVTCDEGAFEGFGVFLLGTILAQFFAKYVSINSFTETVLRTVERGEVMRWTPLIGRRQIA